MSTVNLLKPTANQQMLKNRYGSRASAMSMYKTKTTPAVFRQSLQLRNQTPVLSPIPALLMSNTLDYDLMVPEEVDTELDNSIMLQRRQLKEHVRDVGFPEFIPFVMAMPEAICDMISEKLEHCTTAICDFSDRNYDKITKQKKKECLNDIRALLENPQLVKFVNYMHLEEFRRMIEEHLDFDNKDVSLTLIQCSGSHLDFCEMSWPHLSVVYAILTKLVQLYNTQIDISVNMQKRLLRGLKSPDAREREAVVSFFAAFLRTSIEARKPTITALVNMITDYIDLQEDPFGVCSALQLWREFSLWFNDVIGDPTSVLLRLAVAPHVSNYFPALMYSLERQAKAGNSRKHMLKYLMGRFPIQPAQAQMIRLMLIGKLLEEATKEDITGCETSIIELLKACGTSSHAKVVRCTFEVLSRAKICELFRPFGLQAVEALCPVILGSMKDHWSRDIRFAAVSALRTLQKLHPSRFEALHRTANSAPEPTGALLQGRNWTRILAAAGKKDKRIERDMLTVRFEIEKIFGSVRDDTRWNRSGANQSFAVFRVK